MTLKKESPIIFFRGSREASIVIAIIFCIFIFGLWHSEPHYYVDKVNVTAEFDIDKGQFYRSIDREMIYLDITSQRDSKLLQLYLGRQRTVPLDLRFFTEYIFPPRSHDENREIWLLSVRSHLGYWSLLPALITIFLCWYFRKPLLALIGGSLSGIVLLTRHDKIPSFLDSFDHVSSDLGMLVQYLLLLGALLGVWGKTGAPHAFAELMAHRLVKGPKTARFVAWILGFSFFQGGTFSTVLVGTTVKPMTDKEKISHEELAYIVDSTASPVSSLIAINAWPGYIQSLIFVSGVSYLATIEDRVSFYFNATPFRFYVILAILGTLLLCFDKAPFLGQRMQRAIKRARESGKLDRAGAIPLNSIIVARTNRDYLPSAFLEFLLPLFLLLAIAVMTFIVLGFPEIPLSFAVALLTAIFIAKGKGMSIDEILFGTLGGIKGVILGSTALIFAIIIGLISKELGGGLFLIRLLEQQLPLIFLPAMLMITTIVISFSTGTSWGTYAITFPLVMPLSWAMISAHQIVYPEIMMTLCFAAVMDGSIYGDQCSPISDTTVLSAMSTGCDLMDHVKTQIHQASFAAFLSIILWTISAIYCIRG